MQLKFKLVVSDSICIDLTIFWGETYIKIIETLKNDGKIANINIFMMVNLIFGIFQIGGQQDKFSLFGNAT